MEELFTIFLYCLRVLLVYLFWVNSCDCDALSDVFCSAGLLVVGDICGSGRPQQEQADPVLLTAPRVSLTCESAHATTKPND